MELGPLRLRNPLVLAAGTWPLENPPRAPVGAMITKTITARPREGNPPPRLLETPAGLMNSIGLENPGVDAFVERYLPRLRGGEALLLVSVGGEDPAEYAEVARALGDRPGIAGLELNLSCPNVRDGARWGSDPSRAARAVRAVRAVSGLPLLAKLPPDAPALPEVAEACLEAGADGLSLVNAFPAMAICLERCRPVFSRGGALSGPAIRPLALLRVWQVCRHLRRRGRPLAVLGGGGVAEGRDVLEFILAGASAVFLGTVTLYDPQAPERILGELRELLGERPLRSLVGGALT